MILIAIILDLIFCGVILTYFFKLKLFFEERIAIGLLFGFILLGYLTLLFSHIFGLNLISFSLFLLTLNVIGLGVLIKNKIYITGVIIEELLDFKNRCRKLSWKILFVLVCLFILIFGYLASQLFIFKNDRYFVQPVHAYGDISLHLGIISSFAYGDNFPVQSPILAGSAISYPFLFDFITAIFVNPLGLTLDQATVITGILGMVLVIFSVAYFGLIFTSSKLAAILVLILFFFSGGLGFIYFFQDLFSSNLTFFEFISHITKDYTALKDIGFYWINVVLMMLLPQRSFLLGLPLSLLIIRLFWELSEEFILRKFALAVILTSVLPIIHGHSLIALVPILGWLILIMINKNRSKLFHILLLGLMGLMIAYLLSRHFLQQADNPLQFIKVHLGWMAGNENIAIFYLKNFGLILLILPIVLWFGIKKRLKVVYLALMGQIWFILPSIFIFQPWDFDNTKLFIYWYILTIPLVAYFISWLFFTKKFVFITFGCLLIIGLTLSGGLDIVRLLSSSGTKYEAYSPQAIKLAEFVKNNTPSDAVFLSIDKFDNPAVALAGRKTVVGYHGWLWTYGLSYSQRELDVRNMLAGHADRDLFQKYNITHTILFNEQTNYVIQGNYFNQFRLIYDLNGYKVYKI